VKAKALVLSSGFFFPKSCRLCDNVEKYFLGVEQDTYGVIMQRRKNAICMLDN